MRPLKGYQLAVCVSKNSGDSCAARGGPRLQSAKPRLRRWSNTIAAGTAAWEAAADGAGNLKRSLGVPELCAILDEGRGVAGNNNSTATLRSGQGLDRQVLIDRPGSTGHGARVTRRVSGVSTR
jgi:hypothetical protein